MKHGPTKLLNYAGATLLLWGCQVGKDNQPIGKKNSPQQPMVSESISPFTGTWKSEDGKDNYLYIAAKSGFICASDTKSDSYFDLNGDTMENGDYFTGDKLSLANSNGTLIRKGNEKGTPYEDRYQKTLESLPERCAKAIEQK